MAGGGRGRARQQLDAVTSEQRHVAFSQPQHGVDPEPGSTAWVVGCDGGQSGGEAGVDVVVACLDATPAAFRLFEFGAGDRVVGREPWETTGSGHVEQHAPGEHSVLHRGDGMGGGRGR